MRELMKAEGQDEKPMTKGKNRVKVLILIQNPSNASKFSGLSFESSKRFASTFVQLLHLNNEDQLTNLSVMVRPQKS